MGSQGDYKDTEVTVFILGSQVGKYFPAFLT